MVPRTPVRMNARSKLRITLILNDLEADFLQSLQSALTSLGHETITRSAADVAALRRSDVWCLVAPTSSLGDLCKAFPAGDADTEAPSLRWFLIDLGRSDDLIQVGPLSYFFSSRFLNIRPSTLLEVDRLTAQPKFSVAESRFWAGRVARLLSKSCFGLETDNFHNTFHSLDLNSLSQTTHVLQRDDLVGTGDDFRNLAKRLGSLTQAKDRPQSKRRIRKLVASSIFSPPFPNSKVVRLPFVSVPFQQQEAKATNTDSSRSLTLLQLGSLLYIGGGFRTIDRRGKFAERFSPNAGNLGSCSLAIQAGDIPELKHHLYRYRADRHHLVDSSSIEARAVVGAKPDPNTTQVLFLGQYAHLSEKYGAFAAKLLYLDAGASFQHLKVAAELMGLSLLPKSVREGCSPEGFNLRAQSERVTLRGLLVGAARPVPKNPVTLELTSSNQDECSPVPARISLHSLLTRRSQRTWETYNVSNDKTESRILNISDAAKQALAVDFTDWPSEVFVPLQLFLVVRRQEKNSAVAAMYEAGREQFIVYKSLDIGILSELFVEPSLALSPFSLWVGVSLDDAADEAFRYSTALLRAGSLVSRMWLLLMEAKMNGVIVAGLNQAAAARHLGMNDGKRTALVALLLGETIY